MRVARPRHGSSLESYGTDVPQRQHQDSSLSFIMQCKMLQGSYASVRTAMLSGAAAQSGMSGMCRQAVTRSATGATGTFQN